MAKQTSQKTTAVVPKKIKSAQEHAADFSPRLRSIALVIVAFAFVMDLLDVTIVNIAIPAIQTNLGASYSAIQWIVAGYSLLFALLLVTGGRMGDIFGYKKLFLTGVAGFSIASLISGVAPTIGFLIAGRLLQGAMAALMVPQVLSLMQVMYKPEERGKINGLFGGLGGASASLGPVVGGILIKANIANLDWRPIFLINVPVGLFAFFAGIKYLPSGKSPHPLKLDFIGTLLIMVSLLLVVFPLIQGRELDWPTWAFISMAAALPVFATFVYWQIKKEKSDGSPLVLPSLFKNRSFSVGLLLNIVIQGAMISYFLTFTLMLQAGLGFTPLHAALTGLPLAVGIAVTMATMGEKIIPKLGRYSFSVGTFLVGLGFTITTLLFQHYQASLHSWQLIPGLLLTGIGMGFFFASLFAAVLNGVDARHAGSASGTLNAVQQVGGAIGVAIIGVIFFGQLGSAAPRNFAPAASNLRQDLTSQQVPTDIQDSVTAGLKTCFIDYSRAKDTSKAPASCQQLQAGAKQASPAFNKAINKARLAATANNFANAYRWSTVYQISLLVLVFAITFLLPRHFKQSAYQEV